MFLFILLLFAKKGKIKKIQLTFCHSSKELNMLILSAQLLCNTIQNIIHFQSINILELDALFPYRLSAIIIADNTSMGYPPN